MNNYTIQSDANKGLFKPVIITGLVAGTLDAIGAIVVYQAKPLQMFQFIASGAIGRDAAFSGGWYTALLGVLFHCLIATSWTALFFWFFPRIERLRLNKYIVGILYGAVIWVGMNLIVVPLSIIGIGIFTPNGVLIGMSILMVMVGIPISWLAHRFLSWKS